jgi:hypothetical protein
MFSAIPQKNRVAATTYFDEHLSHNDYYTQGEVLAHDQGGHWIGIGTDRLGLQPGEAVTREVFLRLCDNLHPMTGEQLTPQQFGTVGSTSTSSARRPSRCRFWQSR